MANFVAEPQSPAITMAEVLDGVLRDSGCVWAIKGPLASARPPSRSLDRSVVTASA